MLMHDYTRPMPSELPPPIQEIIPAQASIADVRARALELVEKGDILNALSLTVRCLCPERNDVDLATAKYVQVNWNAQDGEDPMIQEIINQALALLQKEPGEIKKGIAALLTPPTDDYYDEPPRAAATLPTAERAPFSPEAHRAALIEAHVEQNIALPHEVKVWLLKLLATFPDLFKDPETTVLEVVYQPNAQYAPTKFAPMVVINFKTRDGRRSKSFREGHLTK